MKYIFSTLALIVSLHCTIVFAAKMADIPYSQNADYTKQDERRKLDIYFPENKNGFATLVWFHGGGLTGGDKSDFPKELLDSDFAVVSANYRLSPSIKANEAVVDGAEAVAWVFENIEALGGDPKKIFVGGHSAGGYIAGMVGANPEYLKARNISNTDIAGLIPVSAQVTTHFQVKKDLGDNSDKSAPKIDEYAILGHVTNKMPPICIIVGDRKIEWPCRVQENEFLAATLRELKTSPCVEFFELEGKDHGTVVLGASEIADKFIHKKDACEQNFEGKQVSNK